MTTTTEKCPICHKDNISGKHVCDSCYESADETGLTPVFGLNPNETFYGEQVERMMLERHENRIIELVSVLENVNTALTYHGRLQQGGYHHDMILSAISKTTQGGKMTLQQDRDNWYGMWKRACEKLKEARNTVFDQHVKEQLGQLAEGKATDQSEAGSSIEQLKKRLESMANEHDLAKKVYEEGTPSYEFWHGRSLGLWDAICVIKRSIELLNVQASVATDGDSSTSAKPQNPSLKEEKA